MDTEELRKLLDEATPGPWETETVRTSCGVCHKIGPWPHKWRHGQEMSACIYDDYPSPPEGTGAMLANARLIAIAPTLARKVIAAERLVEALRLYSCENECDECADVDRDRVGCGWVARQALAAWEAAQ